MFTIQSLKRLNESTVEVTVTMPVKEWTKSDKGFLYGIDISNQVYRSLGVKASHPTVDSSKRPSKGIKTLVLYYEDSEWSPKLRLVA